MKDRIDNENKGGYAGTMNGREIHRKNGKKQGGWGRGRKWETELERETGIERDRQTEIGDGGVLKNIKLINIFDRELPKQVGYQRTLIELTYKSTNSFFVQNCISK